MVRENLDEVLGEVAESVAEVAVVVEVGAVERVVGRTLGGGVAGLVSPNLEAIEATPEGLSLLVDAKRELYEPLPVNGQ